MIKLLSTNIIKAIFIGLIAFLMLFLLATNVFAQEASSPTEVSDVTTLDEIVFPIDELGGCEDYGSCIQYCDDPVNYNSCVSFATDNGFHRENRVLTADDEFWQNTQDNLGCDSQASCETYCSDPGNYQQCSSYAQSQSLVGGYTADPAGEQVLTLAQEVLGCDSAESCLDFCSDPANNQACDDFANRAGIQGGDVTSGPGGCEAEGTCQSYCSDPNNFEECGEFTPPEEPFQGPGECDGLGDCRSYCEENAQECRSYYPGSNGVYVPVTCPEGQYHGPGGNCTLNESAQEANECVDGGSYWDGTGCDSTPPPGVSVAGVTAYFQPRADMGGCATPSECYDYCTANPGSCGGFNPDTPRPETGTVPSVYITPGTPVTHEPIEEFGNCDSPGSCYDYCRDNAGTCPGFNPNAPRPSDTYFPNTYYTPPDNYAYYTPGDDYYYITPFYYTPPSDSNYPTPTYYTPGTYYTPNYYTPSDGSYVTPSYSTPGYYTPSEIYITPEYYTPWEGGGYITPEYYTPPPGSEYVTPSYYTPGEYVTPSYYTPSEYYTPGTGGNYYTPSYYTPGSGSSYVTPSYYTPSSYYTPYEYITPGYDPGTGQYYTPSTYYSPYYTPGDTGTYYTPYFTPEYITPGEYYTPYYTPSDGGTGYYSPTYEDGGYSYPTPGDTSYNYPTPGDAYYYYPSPDYTYYTPDSSYYSPGYPSPDYPYYTPGDSGGYYYPTPGDSGGYSYPSPSYAYPTPGEGGGYFYPSPSDSYGTPDYPSPSYEYPTPDSYSSPSYDTPSYDTPSYDTPSYNTPDSGGGETQGARTGILDSVVNFFGSLLGL